jgi:hypothetical protein
MEIEENVFIKNNKCYRCGKALREIGIGRKNGKDYFRDWNDRKFHKKCFKEHKERQELEEMLKKINKKFNNYFNFL